MTTEAEDRRRLTESFENVIAHWNEVPLEKLTRQDLGTFGFDSLTPRFEEIKQVAGFLSPGGLASLPLNLLRSSAEAFGNIETRRQEVESFNPTASSNAGQDRNNIAGNFGGATVDFIRAMAPVVGFVAAQRIASDWSGFSNQALGKLQAVDKAALVAESRQRELDEILRVARETVQKVGVARHAEHFSEQAKEHEEGAKVWLIATTSAALITTAAAMVNFLFALKEPVPVSAQLVLAKLILFSLLLSAVVWCGRMYRSHRHNYIVNKHRQNALMSFETFAKGSDDPQTKNAVLLQATQSIFMPQQTGYITQEVDAAGPTQLIELIRNVSPPKP